MKFRRERTRRGSQEGKNNIRRWLILTMTMLWMIALPAIAHAQCDDITTARDFASSLPNVRADQHKLVHFTVRELGQHSGKFQVTYAVGNKQLLQKNISDRDEMGGGLFTIVATTINGNATLGFVYGFGAAGHIGCVIEVRSLLAAGQAR